MTVAAQPDTDAGHAADTTTADRAATADDRAPPTPAPRKSRGYTTVRKAMAVISAFSYGDPVLGVSELSRRLGLGKSTVHRVLTTLAQDGYVERTADDRYRLSLRMYEIGWQVAVSTELRQLAHPALERLHQDTGETAHLAVLSGTDVVYLDRLESPHMLRLLTQVGRRRAAHATSSGKVLLAFGSPADVERVLATGLPRLGPRTITTGPMLEQALAEVRRRGCAVSIEEAARGVTSVAAPIFDGTGECVAAMSVVGPVHRMGPERIEHCGRLVMAAAASIPTTAPRGAA